MSNLTDEKPAVEQVLVYDTTLRDGSQREGISLSLEDKLKITQLLDELGVAYIEGGWPGSNPKLKITQLLDELGVAYIEGGWPGSNPKDATYFQAVQDLKLTTAKIAAFGSTCRVDSQPADDDNIKALVDAQTPVVTVVGKSSLLHVYEVLRTTPEENVRMIRESLAHLKSLGREVIYDAEHFFDGYKADANYALQTLQAAVDGGADNVTLCDTNGGTMYWDLERIVCEVALTLPGVKIGIHTHNDSELGVANTLAGVRGGASLVQGTINGYGERCGNANL